MVIEDTSVVFLVPQPSFPQEIDAPTSDPDVGAFYSMLVQKDWLLPLVGAAFALTQSTTWRGTDEEKQNAQNRAYLLLNQLALPKLSTTHGTRRSALVRRNESGVFQTSADDGASWQDAPLLDPMRNPTMPLQTGDNRRCNAAASATRWFRDTFDAILGEMNAGLAEFGVLTALVPYTVELSPTLAATIEFVGLVAACFGYGATAVGLALSSEQYDKLQCIIYANMTVDGGVDEARWLLIISDVLAKMDIIAAAVVVAALDCIGWGGLSNAGAMRLADGNCDMCDWEYIWDFTISGGGFSGATWGFSSLGNLEWVVGRGWHTPATPITSNAYCGENHAGGMQTDTFEIGIDTTLSRIAVWATPISGESDCSYGTTGNFTGVWIGDGYTSRIQPLLRDGCLFDGFAYDDVDITNVGVVSLNAQLNRCGSVGEMSRISITGNGTKPAFTGGHWV